MLNPKNLFKAALQEGRHQLGMWNTIGGNTVADLLGGAGFDWVLIDLEHSPIGVVEVQNGLQALAGNPGVSAAVRPPSQDPATIKRLLDMGVQTLLLPYVQSKTEAEAAVQAVRYGPRGIRGMAGMTRATRYGQIENYFETAEDDICLILQIESVAGLDELDSIATTEGVDAVFFGPSDLSASMGYPGQMNHPEVVAAIETGLARLAELGVPGGAMVLNVAGAKRFIERGSKFTAVGVDLVLLAEAVRGLRQEF